MNAEPRPQRTVVHVEPNPVPPPDTESTSQPGSDTANPYSAPSPYAPAARDDDSARGRDAGVQERPPSDDNAPASEDRLLDRRE
jgi:hypothetical protein